MRTPFFGSTLSFSLIHLITANNTFQSCFLNIPTLQEIILTLPERDILALESCNKNIRTVCRSNWAYTERAKNILLKHFIAFKDEDLCQLTLFPMVAKCNECTSILINNKRLQAYGHPRNLYNDVMLIYLYPESSFSSNTNFEGTYHQIVSLKLERMLGIIDPEQYNNLIDELANDQEWTIAEIHQMIQVCGIVIGLLLVFANHHNILVVSFLVLIIWSFPLWYNTPLHYRRPSLIRRLKCNTMNNYK